MPFSVGQNKGGIPLYGSVIDCGSGEFKPDGSQIVQLGDSNLFMKTKDLIVELQLFLKELSAHEQLYLKSLNRGEVVKNHERLQAQEEQLNRQFGRIEPYIRKRSILTIYEPQTRTRYDPWIESLMEELPLRKGPALRGVIKELNKILGYYESIDKEEILLEDLSVLFDSLKLHPAVVRVSKKAFESGLYAEAILNAFKEVIVTVREVSELRDEDGTSLMEHAFSVNAPKIKLNKLVTKSDRDEQIGFMHIFIGVALGIRNPKAHDNIEQKDPYKTLEYLSIASLLMKRIDERIT